MPGDYTGGGRDTYGALLQVPGICDDASPHGTDGCFCAGSVVSKAVDTYYLLSLRSLQGPGCQSGE